MCAKGFSCKAIALRLDIQVRSINNYLSSIYAKLAVRNKEDAMLYYWGLPRVQPHQR